MRQIRLGINIDHVATIRNARGGEHPDTVRAAALALEAGGDGITVHLREDRRHIRDDDVFRLKQAITAPINLEMAATEEMTATALKLQPHAVCLVPERREEVTTEGGLDATRHREHLAPIVARLNEAGIRVSLFIDPDERQVEAASALRAPVVELHTGAYADAADTNAELQRLVRAAARTGELGIECHAGHGLNYDNVGAVAAIPQIVELNIGHYLVGEAIFVGLRDSIAEMKRRIDAGMRSGV
jgi:pyridoxine 5-phosphate synthase